MSAKTVRIPLLLSILVALFFGCSSSKIAVIDQYPEFPAENKYFEKGVLFVDVCVIDDIAGDTDKVDIVTNRSIGQLLQDTLAHFLASKGYEFRLVEPPSVGMLVSSDMRYRIVQTASDKERDNDELPAVPPPFFVDSTLASDTALTHAFALHDLLSSGAGQAYSRSKNIAEHKSTATAQPIVPLFAVTVFGKKVPFSKSMGQGLLTSLLSLGTYSKYEVSGFRSRFWVIDLNTGRELWSDARYVKGGSAGLDDLIDWTMVQVADLPGKGSKTR